MKLNKTYLAIPVAFILGFALSRQFTPTKTVIQEKEVVKEKKVVDYVKVRVKSPDGTVRTETIYKDRSTTDSSKEVIKSVETKKPEWAFGAYTDLNREKYALSVDRRIIGNIWVSATANTEKDVFIGVKMEF